MTVTITNIAVSWKFPVATGRNTKMAFNNLVTSKGCSDFFTIKYYANFAVLRCISSFAFVYVVFYGGHVNCTGIRRRNDLKHALLLFKRYIKTNIFSLKIQAVAATCFLGSALYPSCIKHFKAVTLNKDKVIIVRNYFSGFIIRYSQGGTAQIFYSGKVNFLGIKTKYHLDYMHGVIRCAIEKCATTPQRN